MIKISSPGVFRFQLPLCTYNADLSYKLLKNKSNRDYLCALVLARLKELKLANLTCAEMSELLASLYDTKISYGVIRDRDSLLIKRQVNYVANLVDQEKLLFLVEKSNQITEFDEELLNQVKEELLLNLQARLDQPSQRILEYSRRSLFEDYFPVEEQIKELTSISIDEVRALDTQYAKSEVVLLVSQEKHPSLLQQEEVKPNDYILQNLRLKNEYSDVIINENKEQANLVINYKLNQQVDSITRLVMLSYFASGSDSLLFKIIREEHHLCYSVYGLFEEEAVLSIAVGLNPEKLEFCEQEIDKIISRIKSEEMPLNLDQIKNQITSKIKAQKNSLPYNTRLILNHQFKGQEFAIDKIIDLVNQVKEEDVKNLIASLEKINKVILK